MRETVDDGKIVNDGPLYNIYECAVVYTKTIIILSVWYISLC